ncbi:MAG: sialate O-acetylesterase, partial [Marinilabiliales bacterium]|nr:sialate O-acetylesterase [Marinilabiliales bacterium]
MKGILIHIFTSLMILQGAQAMERIGGSCIQSPSQMDSAHSAALSLGKPFMHHMVLQSGVEIPVWGSSVPNATITVEAANQKRVTRSMKDGSWQVWLAPMKPGKPFQIRVSSDRGDKLLLEDLLAGDVWLCAGQSNMEFPLERSEGGKAAIDHSQNRSIRLFQLKGRVRPDAVVWDEAVRSQLNRYDFFEGSWKVCDPSSCHDFSAIGCYFGFCMEAERKVPVGLISLSVGGAPLEAFMDSAVLRETSEV